MDYTAELLRVCGIAILCSICLLTVGRISQGIGGALRVGGAVLIFGTVIVALRDNVSVLEGLVAHFGGGELVSEAFSLMLKALGIALISKFCSDVCRDCGEGSLAGGVESMGRIAIISLCIPVLMEILGYASRILDMGG